MSDDELTADEPTQSEDESDGEEQIEVDLVVPVDAEQLVDGHDRDGKAGVQDGRRVAEALRELEEAAEQAELSRAGPSRPSRAEQAEPSRASRAGRAGRAGRAEPGRAELGAGEL